jgi:hypothetical protein
LFLLVAVGSAAAAGQTNGATRGSFGVSASGSSSSASGLITVSGIVTNAINGLPVSRALVRLNDRAILTDHEGKFEFDQFSAASTATLQVTKPGYYSSAEGDAASSTVLRADQMASTVAVRIYPEALLTGTVSTADGVPLPQVLVSAQRSTYNDSGHQWAQLATNMTNSRGEFRLPVPPGDYRIETGFSPRIRETGKAMLPLTVPPVSSSVGSGTIHVRGGTEERFDLHPVVSQAYPVTIHVESTLERVFPTLSARSSDGTILPVNMARGGPDGDMRIELPSGTYTLMANQNMGDASAYGETSVTVTDRPATGVVLRMATVPSIPVDLIMEAGSTSDKAPPSVQQLGLIIESLQDSPLRPGGYSTGPVMSRDREAYIHAPPGTYHFQTRNTGQWYVKSATYGATDLLQQDLVIALGSGSSPIVVTVSNQTGSLHGTATLNGSPASLWVYLIPTGPSATAVYTARSGADGSFDLPYMPPGSYQTIAFESRHPANFRDPKALAAYSTYMHSVTVTAGNKTSVDILAVPSTELVP